ncbi:energy transducer TonB [Alteriqipengyuania sp.]|uniref:energy transducer TonB n=1 Tax=Alteriqipengyuania sp. TaxID=2800692 RepID=UPI0035184066
MQAKSSLGLDAVALIIAGALHLALVALLLVQGLTRDPIPVPERITVNFAEEVGMTSATPDPVPESAASVAPELGEAAPPPIEYTPPPPMPERRAAPTPTPRETRRPVQRTEQRRETRTTPTPARQEPPRETRRSGGSRVGDDFLAGQGNSTTTSETRIPASQIGASAQASIQAAFIRQIRPHWSAPSGVDVEQLVTLLDFDLNPDGSLKGRPRVRDQLGETEANRAQKQLHAERAIRAVQLAAPFDLPPEYYNAWKSVRGARFDRNL